MFCVAFRVDCAAHIGMGHWMRCMTLAKSLTKRGIRVIFAYRDHGIAFPNPANITEIINIGKGVDKNSLIFDDDYSTWAGVSEEEDFIDFKTKVLNPFQPDMVIVDHYSLGAFFEKSTGLPIIAIDDLHLRRHHANIILNQNPGACGNYYSKYNEVKEPKLLMGTKFALLRESFSRLRDESRDTKELKKMMVFFGGHDPTSETRKLLHALRALSEDQMEWAIVYNAQGKDFLEIKELCRGLSNVEMQEMVNDFDERMAETDLFFGACGTTSLERCCLGVPAATVIVADNQKAIANHYHNDRCIELIGDGRETTAETWKKFLTTDLAQIDKWRKMRKTCLNYVDGKGTERVVDAIMSLAKKSGCLK